MMAIHRLFLISLANFFVLFHFSRTYNSTSEFVLFNSTLLAREPSIILNNRHIVQCRDNTKLMPFCKSCITDLGKVDGGTNGNMPHSGNSSKCSISDKTRQLREQIASIARGRYSQSQNIKYSLNLYPYLSKNPFMQRHELVGSWLSRDQPRRVLDIGTYTNPLQNFISDEYCPELIVSIEPCGELSTISKHGDPWQSIMYPCHDESGGSTHLLVIPITIQEYVLSHHFATTDYDAVVCIGCDVHYGPKLQDFEALRGPFHLYLGFALLYEPSRAAFGLNAVQQLCGTDETPADEITFHFDTAKNETDFIERYLAHYICKAKQGTGFRS